MALITKATIEAALRTWIDDEIGGSVSEVIFGDQAAPRPATPYALVGISPPRALGWDVRGEISDQGVQTLRGDRAVTVNVQVIGSGAIDLARACSNALQKESARSKLASSGLAPTLPEPMTDLTGLLDTAFEERVSFDVDVFFADEYTDNTGLIEHVEGQGTIDGAATSPVTFDFKADQP